MLDQLEGVEAAVSVEIAAWVAETMGPVTSNDKAIHNYNLMCNVTDKLTRRCSGHTPDEEP